jgi:hypothetical protein
MRLQVSASGAQVASILLGKFRWDQDLIGDKNGMNVTFKTPEIFVQSSNLRVRVHLNGQRLRLGASNDYTVAESSGVGTGFDTIILAIAPRNHDVVIADYIVR